MKTQTLSIESAQALLAEHAPQFDTLAALLIETNKKFNLTRITDPDQIRTRHFLDSLIAVSILDESIGQAQAEILDIGSGPGFPVLPLAIVRPGWSFVSLEATGKKCRFQQHACEKLNLKNVQITQGRAEDLARQSQYRHKFDVVTARALADLPILLELALPLTRSQGTLLCWKGKTLTGELARSQNTLKTLHALPTGQYAYTLPEEKDSPIFSILEVKLKQQLPLIYPRSYNFIKKKPI